MPTTLSSRHGGAPAGVEPLADVVGAEAPHERPVARGWTREGLLVADGVALAPVADVDQLQQAISALREWIGRGDRTLDQGVIVASSAVDDFLDHSDEFAELADENISVITADEGLSLREAAEAHLHQLEEDAAPLLARLGRFLRG